MDILITGPSLADRGGVASYYNAVFPYLQKQDSLEIHYMEIGGTRGAGGILHPVIDQIRFRRTLVGISSSVVHINPSLNLKSYIRDGLFVCQAKRLGYLVVVFFHGWDENFESAVETWWLWFFRRTYLKADAFIVLSSSFREKLKEWGVIAPIHLGTTTVSNELVQNFSFTEKLKQLTTALEAKVLFLARLEKEKGVMETLEAVTMLRAKGRPVSLTVAGDGDLMGEVRKFVDQHDQLGKYIFVTGDVRGDDKKSLLVSHHIYCLPTYGEGMPTSVLEAMAFGMPIITCATGGLRDFFADGRMGYLVKQRAVADVANAIVRLIDNLNMIQDMSHYNYHYSREKFLAPGTADFLADVYRQVQLTVKR